MNPSQPDIAFAFAFAFALVYKRTLKSFFQPPKYLVPDLDLGLTFDLDPDLNRTGKVLLE